jgi:hypothetical protein
MPESHFSPGRNGKHHPGVQDEPLKPEPPALRKPVLVCLVVRGVFTLAIGLTAYGVWRAAGVAAERASAERAAAANAAHAAAAEQAARAAALQAQAEQVAWEADAKMLVALLALAEAQRGQTQEVLRKLEDARALLRVKPRNARAQAAAKDWGEEHQHCVKVEADRMAVTREEVDLILGRRPDWRKDPPPACRQ